MDKFTIEELWEIKRLAKEEVNIYYPSINTLVDEVLEHRRKNNAYFELAKDLIKWVDDYVPIMLMLNNKFSALRKQFKFAAGIEDK